MVIYQAGPLIGLGLTSAEADALKQGRILGISCERLDELLSADFVCVHVGQDGAAIGRALAYTEERKRIDLLPPTFREVTIGEADKE